MLRKTLASFDELLEFLQSEPSTNNVIDGSIGNGDEGGNMIESEGNEYLLLKETC